MARELLYKRLAEKLIRSIADGTYPVGSLLPSELQLMAAEKVSRHTVRAALKILEQYGLILRTPHVGTKVVHRGKLLSFDRHLSSLSDLDRLAERNPRRILDIREWSIDRTLAESLQTPSADTCIRFSMVRVGSDEKAPPIAWTTEYVCREWVDLIRAAREYPHLLMIELIERLYRKQCVEVRQVIEARALTEEGARNLCAPIGSPSLRITRTYVDAEGDVLLCTISYHPGDRYAFNLNARVPDRGNHKRIDNDFLHTLGSID